MSNGERSYVFYFCPELVVHPFPSVECLCGHDGVVEVCPVCLEVGGEALHDGTRPVVEGTPATRQLGEDGVID